MRIFNSTPEWETFVLNPSFHVSNFSHEILINGFLKYHLWLHKIGIKGLIPKREKRRLTLLPRIRMTTLFIFTIDNTIKSEDIPYFSFVFAILLLNFQLKLCLQFLWDEVIDFLRANNFQSRPEMVIVTLFIFYIFLLAFSSLLGTLL